MQNETAINGDNVSSLYQSLKMLSDSVSKMGPSSTQLDSLVEAPGSLTLEKTSYEDSRKIADNTAAISDSISSLLVTNLYLTEKTKYENLEASYANGQVDALAVNIIPIDTQKSVLVVFLMFILVRRIGSFMLQAFTIASIVKTLLFRSRLRISEKKTITIKTIIKMKRKML